MNEQEIANIIYEPRLGDTEGMEWDKALKKAKAIIALMPTTCTLKTKYECEHKQHTEMKVAKPVIFIHRENADMKPTPQLDEAITKILSDDKAAFLMMYPEDIKNFCEPIKAAFNAAGYVNLALVVPQLADILENLYGTSSWMNTTEAATVIIKALMKKEC